MTTPRLRLPSLQRAICAVRTRVPARRPSTDGPLPPVPRMPSLKPVLPVSDMARSAEFYSSLGFNVEQYDDGYVWVRHDGWEFLHLAISSDVGAGAGAYVHVGDVDEWHVAMTAATNDDVVGPVVDQPWQMREFAVRDPDGNVVRFGRNL